MARNDNTYGNGDFSDGGTAPSYHSRSEKTSEYSTLTGPDNRFLGVQLTPDMAANLNLMYGTLLTSASEVAERQGARVAEKFATNVLKASKADAAHIGLKAGNYLGYGVIFGKPIYELGQHAYDSAQSLNALRVALQPLNKGSGNSSTSLLSGDNEVVANARSKSNGLFWQRVLKTATNAITIAPALWNKVSKQGEKNRDLERETAYRIAKESNDPKKMVEYFEKYGKELGLHGAVASGHEAEAIEHFIDQRRKAYDEQFKTFKKKYERDIRKDVEERINQAAEATKQTGRGNNTSYENEILRRYDIYDTPDQINRTATNRRNERNRVFTDFKSRNKPQIDRAVERSIRSKFVQQHGAFDDSWAADRFFGQDSRYVNNRDSKPTIQEEIRKNFMSAEEAWKKSKEEAANPAAHGRENETFGMLSNFGFGFAAAAASQWVTQAFTSKSLEEYEKPIALDLILNLRRQLDKAGDHPPETIKGISTSKDAAEPSGYVQYIHKIFQQHRKDCSRSEIGDRNFEHFAQAQWDDKAIMALPKTEITPYEYAIRTIAKQVKDGRLDAIALINLVGDKRQKIVQDDGQTFGPPGAKDDDTARKAIKRIVTDQATLVQSGKQQSKEEINDKLGNFVFSIADLKKALESKELEASQRAFIFTLFSDVVGSSDKLCKEVGISAERCKELRKESQDSFSNLLGGAVNVLSDMIENEPEKVEKILKLTEKEKEMILSLARRSEGKDVTEVAENREEQASLKTVVANAAMKLQKDAAPDEEGKPQNFWRRLVTRSKKKGEEVKAAEDEAKAAKEEKYSKKHADETQADDVKAHSAERKQRPSSREENWVDTVKPHNTHGDRPSPTLAG